MGLIQEANILGPSASAVGCRAWPCRNPVDSIMKSQARGLDANVDRGLCALPTLEVLIDEVFEIQLAQERLMPVLQEFYASSRPDPSNRAPSTPSTEAGSERCLRQKNLSKP